jgi:deoxyribonuclease-4
LRSAEAERVRVLVELMAGTSGAAASIPSDAEDLFAAVADDRLGFCLDTAHLFAAGVPLDVADGVDGLSGELRGRGLAEKLALVHANDSVFERGARRDRHADIGDGLIGEDGWRALANDPLLGSVPWILERPAMRPGSGRTSPVCGPWRPEARLAAGRRSARGRRFRTAGARARGVRSRRRVGHPR